MVSAPLSERAALDELEPRWRKLGYTLVREPRPDQLPAFLKGYRPDAIAVGTKPSLVIEVMQSRSRPAETKIRQLQSLLEGQADWRLEVVYVTPEGNPLDAVSHEEVRRALDQVRLVGESEPRAALLMAWATLEAVGRLLEPNLASRSLPPSSLVDLLISNGHLPQTESAKLRRLGELRNQLAHGQINTVPTRADVQYLIRTIESLAG